MGCWECFVDQPWRRMAQPLAQQIFVGGHAEHIREQPQEMEWADPGLIGGVFQSDWPVRVCIDPQRGFYCAAAVARRIGALFARLAGYHLDKAARRPLAESVSPEVLAATSCRLPRVPPPPQFRPC